MLTLLGKAAGRGGFCDGISRRDFLIVGGSIAGGLSLSSLLRAEATQGIGPTHKSLINIFLPGGPPHQDLWDLKPEAPAEIRGEFKPISTNVPGIQLCELLPKLAAMMDKLAIVRSIVDARGPHYAEQCMLPRLAPDSPSLGAWVSRIEGPACPEVPPNLALFYRTSHVPWGEPGGQKVADVSQRVGSITVDALGYEKERRDLAKGLGVDPYTTNPVLAKKLDDMAWVAFSGRFGIQAAMSVVVPYSMAMSAVTITNTTVYDTPPGDLINRDQATFLATGASEADVAALMKNPQYSLSVLTALAEACQRLQGVNGVASVVAFGAIAKTQDETRLVTAAVNMLARQHESIERLAMVSAPGPVIGRTLSGKLVLPAPVDYVAWTRTTAEFAAREDLKAPTRTAWLSGRMSPMARKELAKRGWKVEESYTIAAER